MLLGPKRGLRKIISTKVPSTHQPSACIILVISVGQSKSTLKVRVNVGDHYHRAGVLEDVVHLELPMYLLTKVAENLCGQGQQSMTYLTHMTLFN